MSRRGSDDDGNEPLDFEPSEHAIDMLKDFATNSTRASINRGSLPDLTKLQLANLDASNTALPSSTSVLLIDRLHSLSTLLSSLLASATSPSLPPSASDVDRLLMSAAVENDKRPIPTLPAVREKVRAWKAVVRLRQRQEAAVQELAGGAEKVKGRRWLAAKRKAPEEHKEQMADDVAAEEQRRLADEQHERGMLQSTIEQLTDTYDEAAQAGLTSHQWSMQLLHSALTHLQARRDWYDQRDSLLALKENRSAFERDRLLTAAAHLNGHSLVVEGTLPALGVKAPESVAAVVVAPVSPSVSVVRSPGWRSVGGSPRLSPLMAARPLHHHAASFTPLVITADVASHSHSPSLSPPPFGTFSLSDFPVTRSPSASISLSRPRSSSHAPATPTSVNNQPSPVRMGGFLLKKSPSSFLFSTWQRRHFRLAADALTYHATAEVGCEPLGRLPLSSIVAVEEREGGHGGKASSGGRFDVLVEGGKCFQLECEGGVEERRVWVSKIREQSERWKEGSKLRSVQRDGNVDSAQQQAKGDKKWWKDKQQRASQGKATKPAAATPAVKAKEKDRAVAVVADGTIVQLSARVARGELEAVKEETSLSAGIGSVLVTRDKAVAIPASWVPSSSPAASPPSASPTYGSTPRSPRSPRSSVAAATIPPDSVLQRQDGSYLLYTLPLTASAELVSSLFDSVSSLSHPNLLLPVLRGTTADAHFLLYSPAIHSPISTPSLQHSSLSSHLRRLHHFDSPSIRHIAHQLVLTLGYLHSEDRTCNRVSVECVHVTDKGEAVVADLLLGLSCRQLVQCVEESREADAEGRVECMSPEQLAVYQRLHRQRTNVVASRDEAKLEDVDEADSTAQRMTDWWRLGVLLYELSTGTPPFLLKLKEYSTPSPSSLASFASPSSAASRFAGRGRLLQVLKSHSSTGSFLLFPSSTPAQLQSLITSLLTVDHQTRLGAGDDWREVLAHPFFTEPPSPLCEVDVSTLDLLDHPQLAPPPFMQHNIIEAAIGGHRAAADTQHTTIAHAKSAVKHYTYHYSLVVTVHNALNVSLPLPQPSTRPYSNSTPTSASRQPTPTHHSTSTATSPTLYVHLQLAEQQHVTRTVVDSRAPAWTQTFEFGLERGVEEADVQLAAVDGVVVAEWAEQLLGVEVRHQAKDSALAIKQQVQHVSVGQAECSVGQLLASAAGASPFALTLLTADGVPNGELLLDVSIREQKLSRAYTADIDTLDSTHSLHTLFSAADVQHTADSSHNGSRIAGSERDDQCQHILAPIARKREDDTASQPPTPHAAARAGHHAAETLRHQSSGFDLDLSYITTRLLCCATPRISHHDVHHSPANLSRFLQQTHTPSHVKTITLSVQGEAGKEAETGKEAEVEEGEVGLVLSCDVCPMWQLMAVVRAMETWLAADKAHVLLLICDDGVKLSGLLACAVLLFDGWCSSPSEAVRLFSQRRCKQPNTQPLSHRQLTYLSYLHSLLQPQQHDTLDPPHLLSVPLRLLHVRISPPPQHLHHPTLSLTTIGPLSYALCGTLQPLPSVGTGTSCWTFSLDGAGGVTAAGDVLMQLCDGGGGSGGASTVVCGVVFNTRWVRDGYVNWSVGRDVDVGVDARDGRRLLDDGAMIELFAVAL